VSEAPAPPTRVASQAVRVTFFEDRAEVLRRASWRPDRTGRSWVALSGATLFLDDRSLRARVVRPGGGAGGGEGDGGGGAGAEVLGARVRRVLHEEPALGDEAIARLEEEARGARRRARNAAEAGARASARERGQAQLFGEWLRALGEVPRWAADGARLAEWRAAYQEIDGAVAAAHAAGADARAASEAAEDERLRAELRLAEGRRLLPRHQTLIEVQVDVPPSSVAAGHDVVIEAEYRTPGALWRPEHTARLDGARVEIVTAATAWQITGEDWSGIEAVFSTARTARLATPPLLDDDIITSRRKAPEERRRIVVEARDQSIELAGLERGTRAVDEMPGVDDGGVPMALVAGPITVASDGRPFRVEVARASLAAEVARVVMPERASAAHIRATATLAGARPLLAGPLRLVRDRSYVGRARLGFVAAGEPFEIGFGSDDAVRVRRQVDEVRDRSALTGAHKLRRTVRVYLSNLSGDPQTVEVAERVPVSEVEQLEIVVDAGPWRIDADGIARLRVDLPPRGGTAVDLAYELRAPASVTLPL
jgi:uncharacterized protein (TIGR02231 family)